MTENSFTRGAYTVRYHFVSCGFCLAERENSEVDFCWVEPLKTRGPNLFDNDVKTHGDDQSKSIVFAGYGPFI
jgi:hypothetical protein